MSDMETFEPNTFEQLMESVGIDFDAELDVNMTCDNCGPSVLARTRFSKDTMCMPLCGHCAHTLSQALVMQGWEQTV